MRNLHYEKKGYRLSKEVIKELENRKGDLSYNQLFKVLLKEDDNANAIRRREILEK